MKHTLTLLTALFLAPLATRYVQSQSAHSGKPNFVFILIDDMLWYGTDLRMDPDLPGSAMAFRHMPNLQRLAKQGMTFQNAYSGAGMRAPSRCCLQTGMTAAHHLYSGNGGFGPKTDGNVKYITQNADAKRPLLCPEPQGNNEMRNRQ
jgi:arylsulfatase A